MNIGRIWNLFLIEFRFFYRKLIFVLLVAALAFLVFSFMFSWFGKMNVLPAEWRNAFYLGWDMLLFGFVWCVMSSFAFADLHHQNEGFYLLLPASSFEKFISKLLGSLVVYPLVSFLTIFLYSLFFLFVIYYVMGVTIPVFLPFYSWLWSWYVFFFVLQAWFFWGSVVFPQNAFVKTILLLFGVSFLISIVSTPILQWLFGTVVSWNGIILYSTQGVIPQSQARVVFSLFLGMAKMLFYFSGLLAYWLSYKSFVKYEVAHGV